MRRREGAVRNVNAVLRARRRAPGFMFAVVLALASADAAEAHQPQASAPVVRAPGYGALEYTAPEPGSYALPPLGPAGDFDYLDSSGARGRAHALYAGKVTVLAFIYTQCEDVNGCPLATFVMGQVARQLAADDTIAPHLRLLSYSFDREHDTPAVLERYARSFRPPGVDWTFATAPDDAALARTLGTYGQSVQRSGGHAYAHILRVFLLDAERRIRNIYSTSFLHADTLAADVRTLLIEQGVLAKSAPAAGPSGGVAPAAVGLDDAWLGLPPATAMNGPPPSEDAIALGEQLFFDRRLSLNRTLSCAMCHVPRQGFTVNELATAVGIEGRTVKRNAPTMLNIAFLDRFFHDARESRLEQQIWGPLLAHNEMANPSVGYVIDNLARWPEYRGRFEQAVGAPPGMESLGRALAAYQRSLIAGGSPFDRWYYGKDAAALDAAAQRGFALFRGKAGCSGCHSVGEDHALFTDQALHNTGLGFRASMTPSGGHREAEVAPGTAIAYDLAAVAASAERPPNDLGRYEVTEDPADRWKFRTPSLRNVALTRPYMHDGSLSTLADVIAFYDGGGVPHELLDPLIRPLGLAAAERADLLAFLHGLTSPHVAALIARADRAAISNPGAPADTTDTAKEQ